MAIHQLLPASSCPVGRACLCQSFPVSAQPSLDYPSPFSCSALRSSLSEGVTTDILLQDSAADRYHGAQQKYLKDERHDFNEHGGCANSCKELISVNGRNQTTDCSSIDWSDRDMCLSKNMHSVSTRDDSQELISEVLYLTTSIESDSEAHFTASEKGFQPDHNRALRDHLEALSVEAALSFLQTMIDEPLPTDAFIPILKNCIRQKALSPARHLHLHMCKHGLEFHGTFKNFLITIHVNCGSVDEAHRLVNQSGEIDQHSWNTLIQGYLDSGEPKRAFKLYKEMEANFVQCRRYILMALLKTFASQHCLEECQELHSKIVERELETDSFFCNTVMDMYLKCGRLIDAQEVFNEQVSKDIVLFSTLISGLADHGHFEDALRCWDQLVNQSLDPDIPTLVLSLKACANVKDLNKGREIHISVIKHMLEKELVVGNSLVDMYAKCGILSESQAVFDELPARDVVSWSALITGYADHGYGQKAITCYDQMLLSGTVPNDITFLGALKACVRIGAQAKGQELHAEIVKEEYESYPLVSSALVDMYSKFGLLSEAQYLFSMMDNRNVITWTALMEAYAENGLFGKAFRCFGQMQSQGILPNSVTFLCILKACCDRGMIERGRYLHSEIIMRGFEREYLVGSMLVHMYSKCASLQEAQFMFDRLPIQAEISWNTVITGYMKNKQEKEAFHQFQQMKERKVLPESATYVALLRGSGSKESLTYGQTIHIEITYRGFEKHDHIGPALVYMYATNDSLAEAHSVFDSSQSSDTASCNLLISSFLEQGLNEMALTFLEKMEMKRVQPDVITWSVCVKACQCPGLLSKFYSVHLQIVKHGFEMQSHISALIVDTYVFHHMVEVSYVVSKRPLDCDSYQWTRVIAASCLV